MRLRLKHILAIIATLVTVSVSAQSKPPIVDAFIEPDSVGIGDVFTLRVDVIKDQVQVVGFAEFEGRQEGNPVEIVGEDPVDTVSVEGRRVKLTKRYRMMILDEGIYSIGRYPILYVDKNITDTIWSRDSLIVMVGTFDIDTENARLEDIKPQLEAPFKFGEISIYLMWTLLVIALIIAALYIVFFLLRKYSNWGGGFLWKKEVIPAHVTAIKELEELHNRKLWQNNKHKAYYTGLSDIVREYLHGRYGMAAMEMTTDEIIEETANHSIPKKNLADLVALLRTADLVKFAQAIPDADRNESMYNKAYYFVEDTKTVEIPAEEAAPNENK